MLVLHFFLSLNNISYFVYIWANWWIFGLFSLFGYLWTMVLWTFVYKFLLKSSNYLRMCLVVGCAGLVFSDMQFVCWKCGLKSFCISGQFSWITVFSVCSVSLALIFLFRDSCCSHIGYSLGIFSIFSLSLESFWSLS